jgi:hypothetical protein
VNVVSQKFYALWLVAWYAIHKPHLPNGGLTVDRGISGELFRGNKAS